MVDDNIVFTYDAEKHLIGLNKSKSKAPVISDEEFNESGYNKCLRPGTKIQLPNLLVFRVNRDMKQPHLKLGLVFPNETIIQGCCLIICHSYKEGYLFQEK